MEINPKRIFSNDEINLPEAKKNRAKGEVKGAEKKSKAPINPAYYSNYYGIHKVSFGQTPKTNAERLEYLKQMKDSKGNIVFDSSQFEPTEDGKDSNLVKLSKNEEQFEFFRKMSSLKYDNGENIYNKDSINQLADISVYLDNSGNEEIEMYGMKGVIRFDNDFDGFIKTFINEKDKSGKYIFNSENIINTLITTYIFKPKDVSAEEVLNTFREINSANEKNEANRLSISDVVELTVVKIADKECKDIDIAANMPKIQEYCSKNAGDTAHISPVFAAKIIMSDEDTQKAFDRLRNYKNSSGEQFFRDEDMYNIAQKTKGDEKVFELIDKLIEKKDENDEYIFKPGVIAYIIQAGETAHKNALKIYEEPDKDKQKSLANMHMAGAVIADDVLFERAQKVFDYKNKEGSIICEWYTAGDIINNENNYNNFIKYASDFAQYSVPNITNLCKLTDKQCSQISELLKLSKKDDETSILTLYALDDYVADDETFELTKKILGLRDKDNKPVIEGYSINYVLKKGKEYTKKYIQAADLLLSTGIEINNRELSELSEDENLLKQAELFKGIKRDTGKPILKYDELIRFAKSEPKTAERIAQILKLKTSDGKYLEIPFHQFDLITKSTDEEFKNFIKYMPKMTELKDTNGNKVFINTQETIDCAKKGEKAYKRAEVLLGFKKSSNKALFNNYNIARSITLDDKSWGILLRAAAEKNSLGESLFTNDSVIISIAKNEDIKDIESFFAKAKTASELRNPRNKQKRLISDEGIYETAKQDKDFISKYKEYIPKLFEIKDSKGNSVVTEENIHKLILYNDMSLERLCHHINSFSNFKTNRSDGLFFSEYNIINALNKGEDYCNEISDLIREMSAKKTNNGVFYVNSYKLSKFLGEDIEKVRTYNKNLDKFAEFNDYPYDKNICLIAETLAGQSDEEIDKAIKLARYKDKNGEPFFTHNEIQYMTIQPESSRHTDVGVIQTLDKETKENLQPLIDSVTNLKEKMLSKPELYINGTYETEDAARNVIKSFFDDYKGRLMLMASIFDKETIDNIMRKRLAVSQELLGKLHGFDEKEQNLLKQLIASTNVDGKPFIAAQKIQFINLISAFKANKIRTDILEEMLKSGKVDIGKAEITLLKNILKKADLDDETIAKIPPEKIYSWNSEYLHLLMTDMKEHPAMKDIFLASLTGNFDDYIQSEDNEYGKINKNTKNIFQQAGLNYNAWVKPNDDLKINYISRDKNEEKLIQITKQIEEDIETLRQTPAKKFIDKQLSKYVKEDKFTVPTNIQTNKNLLKTFVNNTIATLDSVWERAKKNSENPDLKEKANNTLTVLDHLNQRIQDIDKTPAVNTSKNIDLTIKMWERRPEKDIFQGNYSTCCIGIGNFNSSAMPHFVLDTAYNMIELTDNYTGKTIGNALCYLVKEQNGKPAFIIDNIEINNSVKPSDSVGLEIRNKMAEYASKVAKEVTGNDDTSVYMSDNYNDVPTNDLKKECQEIDFIGDISADKIYMDLYSGWIDKSKLKSTRTLLRLK